MHTIMLLEITLDQNLKFFGYMLAFQGDGFDAILEHRCYWRFASTWQADADIGVFTFKGAIDDAAHHCHFHVFYPLVFAFPDRHLFPQIGLDILGQPLEVVACGAAASGASDHHWREGSKAHGLQDFLGNDDFLIDPAF